MRVFSNANGAYSSNVNFVVDSGNWEDDDNLAEQYSRRKCYAYGRSGVPERQAELLQRNRQAPEPVLERAIMVTIAGVAAGMRNTG